MKLTAILVFIICMQAGATALAQKVTLNEQNASLVKVLKDIHQQTGYFFVYDNEVLKNSANITITTKDKQLKEVLETIFSGQPLQYTIEDKTIVIKPKEKTKAETPQSQQQAPAPPVTITGKVTDSVGTPLINATVALKGTTKATITDDNGEFTISANVGDVLAVSYVGYQTKNIPIISGGINLAIQLDQASGRLKEVVVNNGYQSVSAEKVTGAYSHIDNAAFNRAPGSNVLDRLNGMAAGLSISTQPSGVSAEGAGSNYTIRGTASIAVDATPLIILDNFPYEGDINNINPNDIESVTILKDAAAASIWGAKAGNGVIVLTSKHGNLNHPLSIGFNTNVQITNKPNYFKSPGFFGSNDYINTEQFLFQQGYYDGILSDIYNNPAYSPIVGILAQARAGNISTNQADNEINSYRKLDYRSDLEKYAYQNAVAQQYSLNLNGGGNNMSYYLSAGWDKNNGTTVNNSFNRRTINASMNYEPLKRLEISTSIRYNMTDDYPSNGFTRPTQPYELLADARGNALPITYVYSTPYIDSVRKLGFLDWNYYPLNELKNTSNHHQNRDLNLQVNATYKITNFLNVQASYQNEYQSATQDMLQAQQSYYTTNLINEYTQYDPVTGKLTYVFPLGGVLTSQDNFTNVNHYRLQANLNKAIGKNGQLTGLLGSEIEQDKGTGNQAMYYGYNPRFGSFNNYLDYTNSYTINPNDYGRVPYPTQYIEGTELRYISYFGNLGYTYQDKYSISLTGRKDGSNIFGVNTNDKFNLLWSIGGGWIINKENFYHLDWLPVLKIRATYGFNGNIDNGLSGYSIGAYRTESLTGANVINGLTPPNPELSWEKVRNLNFGVDFQLKNNILYGSIDIYRKDGIRLLEPVILAPSTGFSSFTGNAANTKGKGLELDLNSDILKGKFNWTTHLIGNYNTDILTKYSVALGSSSIQTTGQSQFVGVVGKPLYSLYSYKWAGLDPTNGNPRGYLNGQISENYTGIIGNYKPDSLIYNGSATPTIFGSWRNDFAYKRFTLSVMLTYQLDWYFRKPSSTGNYADLLSGYAPDYPLAWKKPGDEQHTYVPSYIYPGDQSRATFYQYSQVLVLNGDNVRLNDVRLSYDLSDIVTRSGLSHLSVFGYASNFGTIWKANKYHIDPDYPGNIPAPLTMSLGLQATLK